jgi:UDP-N-acetylmuramoylalanine--D-glutamate ligase
MKILVIGAGISGKAAASFLIKRGEEVSLVDRHIEGIELPCALYVDTHFFIPFDFDLVVVSPGIPPTHPLYQKAIEENVVVIGEAELAFQKMKKNQIIGVTGSNGKSTTVSMIAHTLKCLGIKHRLLGNIGTPLISSVEDLDETEIIVAEISSFQLETMQSEVFFASALLNITPNHLDRHKTMEEYLRVKLRLRDLTKEKKNFFIDESIAIKGEHTPVQKDQTNSIFAQKLLECLGVAKEDFLKAMETFVPLKHRVQFVASVRGILCYNDSKATSVDAVRHAVERLDANIILLAGGKGKGTDFLLWREVFPRRVKHAILFGESKEAIANDIGDLIPCSFANTLQEAIEKGLQLGNEGDKLLLSPGCSSYDQFRNFEERGDAFIKGVEDESKRYNLSSSSH